MSSPSDVLDFWLGQPNERGIAASEVQKRWWVKDPTFDAEIGERFGQLYADIAAGKHADWAQSPRSAVARIIVLDQFSRNLFRGDAGMFEHDKAAITAAREGVDAGYDENLGLHERFFLYMPFMHCEEVGAQQRCIELMKRLTNEDASFAKNVDFAVAHFDIIERFGRFPHRNEMLGRASTAEELEFLQKPGSSF